jgi:hypothetical protein
VRAGLVLGGHGLVVVDRQVRVLADEQRVEPAFLQRPAQLDGWMPSSTNAYQKPIFICSP